MDADRRANLELAVEFLQSARELNAIAGLLGSAKGDVRKRNRLKSLADRFQDRGLQMVVRDLARATTEG